MTQRYTNFIVRSADEDDLQGQWTIKGTFSTALAAGLLEGHYRCKLFYVSQTKDDKYHRLYGSFNEFEELDVYFEATDKLTDLNNFITNNEDNYNRKTLTERLGTNVYILLIKEFLAHLPGRVTPYTFGSEIELREFLQGILTMTSAFNVPPNEIIAVKPFKGDQDYNIQEIAPLPSII